jgi:hypothetical protein
VTEPWTEEKNQRRCDLIDKEINGHITPAEQAELDCLQQELYTAHPRVTREELDVLRQMYHELKQKADSEMKNEA